MPALLSITYQHISHAKYVTSFLHGYFQLSSTSKSKGDYHHLARSSHSQCLPSPAFLNSPLPALPGRNHSVQGRSYSHRPTSTSDPPLLHVARPTQVIQLSTRVSEQIIKDLVLVPNVAAVRITRQVHRPMMRLLVATVRRSIGRGGRRRVVRMRARRGAR